jgi:hypothetical protein
LAEQSLLSDNTSMNVAVILKIAGDVVFIAKGGISVD